jgi:hypothetical protein
VGSLIIIYIQIDQLYIYRLRVPPPKIFLQKKICIPFNLAPDPTQTPPPPQPPTPLQSLPLGKELFYKFKIVIIKIRINTHFLIENSPANLNYK